MRETFTGNILLHPAELLPDLLADLHPADLLAAY